MRTLKSYFLLACLMILGFLCPAQITGHVSFESVGISFDIPEGWMGQEGDDVLILGSNETPGFVLISSHTNSLSKLQKEAAAGMRDEYGTDLRLSSDLESLSSNAIGAAFEGYMEGEPAKAYIIGAENPYQGPGLMILVATQSELYSSEHEQVAKDLLSSLTFTKVDRDAELSEWKAWLSGVRLTYMDSYYSSGYGSSGISAGYTTEKKIDLCSEGYFRSKSSDHDTFTGSRHTGYDNDSSKGHGTWSIIIGSSGDPTLRLSFYTGEEYDYRLNYEEEEFLMNGDRYFRTTEGEYAPECP
ncbi:hypothetical protein HZ996_00705 [Cryomorphaceae bacterium]|nr:hypothetical protein HZ996_00705 [Cryomorphaceae bacterium]